MDFSKGAVTPEAAEATARGAITSLIEDLDKSHVRRMQASMHLCAAKCCEDRVKSADQVQACMSACERPLDKAHEYIRKELHDFQDRLNRCIMQCQDTAKDKITPTSTEKQVDECRNQYEKCAVNCIDTHVRLLPMYSKRMKEYMVKECN